MFVALFGIGFTVLFQFIFSTIEWSISDREYSLWKGFSFSLFYSGLLIILIYSIISYTLFLLGITDNEQKTKEEYLDKLSFKLKGKTSFINITDVLFFEANDNYISAYTNTNQHHLIRKTISKLETQLDPSIFLRVHRKYLVKVDEVTSVKADPNGGYFIYLPFDKVIKMSKTYKGKLKLILPRD